MPVYSGRLYSRLTLFSVSGLKPHEESRQDMVADLAKGVRSMQVFIDPLIVDKKNHVVLDGTHRLMASKLLKLSRVPVYLVDFQSEAVRVGRWFRAVKLGSETLSKLGLDGPHTHDALGSVDRRECSYALVTKDGCYLAGNKPSSVWGAYENLKSLDRVFQQYRLEPVFVSDYTADSLLKDKTSAYVYTSPITKEEVVESALRGWLLPYKTTRHVVEKRPTGLNLAIKWLGNEATESEALGAFREHLHSLKPRVLPAGTTIKGRVYQESIIVLT